MKTPYPYQEAAISLGLTRSALIADECGLGKTLVGIEIAFKRAWEYGGSTLFIVPKSTLPQWKAELEAQLPGSPPVVQIEGHMPVVPESGVFYLTHYEVLLSLGDHLAKYVWTTVVVDEVHRIKNKDALRTKAIKKLKTARRIGLSGTPMEKTPGDMWSILNWIQPGYFNSYWRFCNHYVAYEEVHRGKEIYRKAIGSQNQAAMAEELKWIMLRRTKQEVAPELPEKIVQHVQVEMTEQQQIIYDRIDKSKDIEVDIKPLIMESLIIPNELSKLIMLQMASSDIDLLGAPAPARASSAKLNWLDDFMDDNPDEVIVVFTRFRGTALKISARRPDEISLLVGGNRTQLDDFLEGRKRVLVGTIAAMGEGLNLQRAGTAIFFEAEWSSVKMTQAVDRIHRINITEPKNIIHLISSPMDELILAAVEHKWSEAELVQQFMKRSSYERS